MEPRFQNLNVGSGQVATAATQITAGTSNKSRPLSIIFSNVGGQQETVILTFSQNGGTAVRIARVELDVDESFRIRALPVDVADSLRAQTDHAASVDYLISIAQPGETYALETYDAQGRLRQAPYVLEQLDATFG